MDKFILNIPRNTKRKSEPKLDKENKKKNNNKNLHQMYIDLGQNNFGKTICCKKCNYFYVSGDLTDEKEHSRYCSSFDKTVVMSSLKSTFKILTKFENDSKIINVKFILSFLKTQNFK